MSLDTDDNVIGDDHPDFVNILVHVAPDKMAVRLTLTPITGKPGVLTVHHLKVALEDAGVVRGIDAAALKGVVTDYAKSIRGIPETVPVAHGVPAAAEGVGALRILVKYITLPDEVRALFTCKCAFDAATLAPKFQRVDKGTVIARRAEGTPSLIGYDVFGSPLEPQHVEILGASPNIVERSNVFIASHTFTAACTGVVYTDTNGIPCVYALDFNGSVDLHVSQDLMAVEATVTPPGERGTMPSLQIIHAMIKEHGVVYGVDPDALELLMDRIKGGEMTEKETFIIAQGTQPIKGEDGRVEFCFNVDPSPAPTIAEDGSADYKNIDIVNLVSNGTVLAKLHPAQKGTPGKNVYGNVVAALNGIPARLPVGANTAIPNDDPNSLISVSDGIAIYDGTSVNVSAGYVISGDVDFKTGNIKYDNSIMINGDVKSGFEVDCGGDLQVKGIIEDCKINVKGNILCKFGFVGTGKGTINADGNVNLNFMKNQTIVAGGNVNIAKEALNCNITATKSINVYGHPLSVAGGTLVSNGSITVRTVGNISGAKTTLQINPEPELIAEMDSIKTAIAKNEENAKNLENMIKKMPPAEQVRNKEHVRKLKNTIILIRQQIGALEGKMRLLNITMNKFENAFIRIDRMAYPGTTVRFGTMNLALSDTLQGGKTIRVINQEIRVFSDRPIRPKPGEEKK
ncbi:MAG: FapA family protein [Chitinispirillales bacterium]|jgi:uncharacterized protein (DUF342 family)|nr:FapA family protein [Chitinispirillales bacterium]